MLSRYIIPFRDSFWSSLEGTRPVDLLALDRLSAVLRCLYVLVCGCVAGGRSSTRCTSAAVTLGPTLAALRS